MKQNEFDELISSIQEAGAIRRGENKAARVFHIDTPDVKSIRESLNLSQSDFSALMGISLRTLQNWEQKRREPVGAARVLLEVAAKHPQIVLETVSNQIREEKEKYSI
jgi:putative transcriptional regulator